MEIIYSYNKNIIYPIKEYHISLNSDECIFEKVILKIPLDAIIINIQFPEIVQSNDDEDWYYEMEDDNFMEVDQINFPKVYIISILFKDSIIQRETEMIFGLQDFDIEFIVPLLGQEPVYINMEEPD